jgi:hypothetical protein
MLVNKMTSMMIRNDKRGEQKQEESNPIRIVGGLESPSANIYYTLSIINRVILDPAGILPSISVPKIAEYGVNRTNTILSNPSNYRVALSRLAIPSGLIPLFLYPTNPSYYTITLTYYNGITYNQYTRNVTYVPSNVGDPYGEFRPVYHINEMIQYVNVAFQQAYNDAIADLGALVYLPKERPYLTFDSKTQLITMYCEEEYLDFNTFGIFMNTTLYENFFSSLYAREAVSGSLTGFNGYQILPQNLFLNLDENVTLPGGGASVNLYKVIEEFSTTALFNALDRIVVTSHRMPINSQLLGTQVDSRAKILFDYILPDLVQSKTKYELDPTRLRWTDLISHTALTSVDLQFYLVYNDGQIVPLYIQADQRIDATLLFVPKGTFYQ